MNDAELLSIDVEAELKKLSLGRLRCLGQVPVALLRIAAAAGAGRVSFSSGRGALRMEHDGSVPDAQALSFLAQLLDPAQPDDRRHQALEALEERGMLDLLVCFALDARRLELSLGAPVNQRWMVMPGKPVVMIPCGPRRGLAVTILDARRDPGAEDRELAANARYAHFQVELNGRRLDQGLALDESVLEVHFHQEGLEGVIGLPRRGAAAVTRWVENGVLVREVWESPADGTIYEAVVCGPEKLWNNARAVIQRLSGELIARAREGYSGLSEGDRARVKEILLRLADHGAGVSVLGGLPLFATADGQYASIEGLQRASVDGLVRAIAPGADPEAYQLSGQVFVLGEREREFLVRHLGLATGEPSRQPPRRGVLLRLVLGLQGRLRCRMHRVLQRLATAAEVPEEALSDAERRLQRALQGLFSGGWVEGCRDVRVALVGGRLGVFRWLRQGDRRTRLQLRRRHPRVKAMAAAILRDPAALYPAALLVLEGQDAFGAQREGALAHLLEARQGIDGGADGH